MKKTSIIMLSLAVVLLTFCVTATASQLFDKKTTITINQPMEIPGTPAIVLPPGTYVLKLLSSASSRSIVQFFNADETKLYSTVIGIPDYRLQTPEKAEISFYETEPGRAHPIRAWFYPGDNYGVEFVYSKARALEVAKATNQHVMSATNPTTSTPAEQPTTAQVSQLQNETVAATTPQGTEVSPAEVHPPATTQTQAEPSQSVTQSSPSSTPIATVASNTPPLKTLPKTASNMPLLALAGIMLLGAALSLRILLN
jgi:LPXTG-motif cell wall-anchored protein